MLQLRLIKIMKLQKEEFVQCHIHIGRRRVVLRGVEFRNVGLKDAVQKDLDHKVLVLKDMDPSS